MSLRVRLLAGLLALVTLGLLVANFATYAALRSFLERRVDQQLEEARGPVANEMRDAPIGRFRSRRTVIPAGTYATLLTRRGTPIATLASSFREASDPPPELPTEIAGARGFRTVAATTGSLRYRVLATPVQGGATLVVALPLREVAQTLGRLVAVMAVVSAATVALLAALALWVVRVGLRPLDAMASTADAIAGGELSKRVEPADQRSEVGRLGLALNAMLERIEGAFAERSRSEERLRRFVADASHELRTPLTSIRGYAELFRRGASERPDDLARAMRRIEEEAARMGTLVDDLLLLARLDQGRALEREAVPLTSLAADAVADARATHPGHHWTLHAPEEALVAGDGDRLRQVVANLLANAAVHTPAGTHVDVRVGRDGARVVLEVADHGQGVPPAEATHLFERFYRADSARSRGDGAGGAGLGLSIVAAIATAQGGSAQYLPTPGGGATFRVELPAWSDDAPTG